MLQLAKACKACAPVAVSACKSIETASYLNVSDIRAVNNILKVQTGDTLILSNPILKNDTKPLQSLQRAYDHLLVVPAEANRKLWTGHNAIETSFDLNGDLKLISSRPKDSSFLEELDDAQSRGRNVIISVDPKDTFHSLMFDSHVVGILGAHKNQGLCKNVKLGRIQFVDWNPDWMLASWVCNKVLA